MTDQPKLDPATLADDILNEVYGSHCGGGTEGLCPGAICGEEALRAIRLAQIRTLRWVAGLASQHLRAAWEQSDGENTDETEFLDELITGLRATAERLEGE